MNGGLGSLRLEAVEVMRNALISAENLQLTLKSDFSSEEQALTNNHSSGNQGKPSRGNEDLKEMLESNKESLKLEAMKRIVGLIAKGKNASELFPAVVKNVASKNIELKKLVYVYLVRYAEEQQDLALLSISTFQRALKDPNQLIRASALRVLSSIRVPIIVPIMMLAIKEAATDLSPYVRKTAAHAIQKLYSLDPDQKEHLIEVIEKLLKDKSTLVAGSVVMAFEEVCPDRIDLIHKNYRKLCNLLVDVEEWGQVVIIHMLTRYARTQFVSPWREDAVFDENNEKAFYDSEEERRVDQSKLYIMDPDHRLLLRNTKPLLQSRNTAVVMAVSQLYWHLAPKHELSIISKSLVRLLRSHREVQYIVLQNIATMSIQRKGMFEPFMKSFYVRSTDATHIKTLKLEILTNLANEANISTILREFQTYVKSQDKAFAAATIQAIGRCATNISEVTDTCLNGLVLLLSNRDETVVAESVVVIKKLLQTQPSQHSDIIKHMAKLFDNITVSMARASILWLMGEYCEHVPKIAPDVLRKMAKSFTSEEDIVKLQTVNLAAKLYLTNSKQTKLLTQYILNLGKYDQNYDIRDRTRFIRQLIVPNEKSGALSKYARRILMAPKPAPVLQSAFKDRDRFQLGTLSHTLNSQANGYLELSDWPAVAPDQSVRNVEVAEPVKEAGAPALGKSKPSKSAEKFYSDSEEEEEEEEGSSSEDSSNSSSEESESEENSDDSDKSSSSQSEKSSSESDSEKKKKTLKNKKLQQQKPDSKDRKQKNGNAVKGGSRSESESGSESSSSESSSESGSESGSELDSDSDSGTDQKKNTKSKPAQSKTVAKQVEKKEVSLLDLDDFSPAAVTTPKSSILSPSLLSDLQGLSISPTASALQTSSPVFVPETSHELLHRMTGKGLSAQYRFTRQPCIYGNSMVSLQLTLSNSSDQALENIHISEKTSTGQNIHRFNAIERLEPQASVTVSMGVDFNDSTQAANFQLCTKEDEFSVSIQPAVGELLLPVTMSEADFTKEQGKLVGMNESSATITMTPENVSSQSVNRKVVSVANLGVIPSSQENIHRFVGKTVSSGSLVLVSVALNDPDAVITINTEKTVMGSMLLRQFKTALTNGGP
ncbi:AP-3 complex subunit beta-1 isoform X1 [Puntigrus tetrazona]|uniref:AP-3 complex subunit beta-1 isoform X1 n=1 Tax=Puntigrus tetrazona TaxID=1606681 RepID=UPI001C8A8C35|nr:AP-3 complex subunit beta-1 isoform X1 [Puntigrus tetrazona]XP_043090276.1 AP-3 complex subunit beta-1 isoform X1 [Puntigrus tetrazona]